MPNLAARSTSLPPGFHGFFAPPHDDTVHLTLGESDFNTPQRVIDAAVEDLKADDTFYIAPEGKSVLREAIAEKLARENHVRYDMSEVTVTVGAKEGIFNAALALLDPGDEILITAPHWHSYDPIVDFASAKAVPVPFRPENYHPDPEAMKHRVGRRTKAVLVNTPNNPSGAVYTRDELKAIVDLAVDHDLFIISDEIYEYMVYDGREHVSIASLPGAFDRTVTVNGFSKCFAMTGWRMGYTAAPKWIAHPMRFVHMHAVTHPSSFLHRAGAVALRECRGEATAMVAKFDERRRFLHGALQGIRGWRLPPAEGAFYLFPDIRGTGLTSLQVKQKLLAAGVEVVEGTIFPRGEGYIRISYAASLESLRKAAGRIESAFGRAG
ncbi:MAG TPA: pyridoxal phosphate-dependent aminotransferase [Candidatus Thermoplasmatota archaeon]